MGQRPESPLGEELPGARGERLVALGERHRDEGALGRGLVGQAAHLVGIDPHRLFYEEGVALVEQVVRRVRHGAVPAEGHDEVRPGLGEHLPVVGEDRRAAERRRPLRRDLGARILHADELHVGHGRQVPQIRRVVQRVPVTHLDGGDPHAIRDWRPRAGGPGASGPPSG